MDSVASRIRKRPVLNFASKGRHGVRVGRLGVLSRNGGRSEDTHRREKRLEGIRSGVSAAARFSRFSGPTRASSRHALKRSEAERENFLPAVGPWINQLVPCEEANPSRPASCRSQCSAEKPVSMRWSLIFRQRSATRLVMMTRSCLFPLMSTACSLRTASFLKPMV